MSEEEPAKVIQTTNDAELGEQLLEAQLEQQEEAKAREAEKDKFSLENAVKDDTFLSQHPIFLKLNSALKGFGVFSHLYEEYLETYQDGDVIEQQFRNFNSEQQLHTTLRSLLENVVL